MNCRLFFFYTLLVLALSLSGCGGQLQNGDAGSGGDKATTTGERRYNWDEDFGAGPFPNSLKGTDRPRIEGDDSFRTFTYEGLTVEVRPDENIGEHIRYRMKGESEFRDLPFIEAGYFAGTWKGRLLVDEGTGPEYRILSVFDPVGGKRIYHTVYNGAFVEGASLVVARPLEDDQVDPKPDCPDLAPGVDMGIGYMEVIRVSASDFREEATGQILCYYRQ